MKKYIIFLDILKSPDRPEEDATYRVALRPLSDGDDSGAMGTKHYQTDKEAFVADLKQILGYSDEEIERFFADPAGHQSLVEHPLCDEDATYFGWRML